MADKFGLRTWLKYLRTWIFGFTYLVFKTTYIDRGKPLREGAFFSPRTMLFPPLDNENTHDKAKGLRISSERHIGELGVRYLSTLNRGQDSRQQSLSEGMLGGGKREAPRPPHRGKAVGLMCGV